MLSALQNLFARFMGPPAQFATLPVTEQKRRQKSLHASREYQQMRHQSRLQARHAMLDRAALSGYEAKRERVRRGHRSETTTGIPSWYLANPMAYPSTRRPAL